MIDRALARFTADSAATLLSAAIDSPACHAWERHLVELWLRLHQQPPRGFVIAGPGDLDRLVAAVTRAKRAGLAHYWEADSDPRSVVRFTIGRSRLRLHPGDYLHAPMTLRIYAAVAAAIDPVVLDSHGFTLSDVLELILRHGDRVATALSDVWPVRDEEKVLTAGRGPVVSAGEIEAMTRLQNADAQALIAGCTNPRRAAAALAWLTRPASKVRIASDPHEPLLGAVLALSGARGTVFVPAALTLAAASAAVSILADEAGSSTEARRRLQDLTNYQVSGLLGGESRFAPTLNAARTETAESMGECPETQDEDGRAASGSESENAAVLEEPPVHLGERTALIALSVLERGELDRALWWAKWRLAEAVAEARASDPACGALTRVVVYHGPAIAAQMVSDTALVHVEELAELFADAQGDESLVLAFFEELTRHPGTEVVAVPDLFDAWLVWRRYTVLVPPGETGLDVVQITDQHDDLPWRRAVAWEAFEPLLEQAGMPSSICWPVTHLEGDEASLYAPQEGMFALLRLDPPVSVMAFYADADYFGMQRDALVGLADGVRSTLGNHPEIAGHMRLDSGAPVTVMLQLSVEPTPQGSPGMRVGLASDPDRALVGIQMSPDVMGLFLTDATDGHRAFGLAIHRAVAELRARRGERPGVDEAVFLAAWDACAPVTTIHVYESETPDLGSPSPLPSGIHLASRVLREIAAEVARRGAPVGTFRTEQAKAVIGEFLLPAVRDVLRRRIQACQPDLLEQAVKYLADAHVLRYKDSVNLANSLSGPFAENWIEHALNASDGAERTRPLETLVEFALAYPPAGGRHVDSLLVAELTELAWQLLLAASRLRNLESTLQDLSVQVLENGMAITETAPEAPDSHGAAVGFDADAYLDARRAQQVAIARQSPPLPTAPAGTLLTPSRRVAQSFTAIDSLDDSPLIRADRLLRESWGTGLDAIRAVLSVARTWDVGDRRSARTDRSTLVGQATEWSGLPIGAVEAALDRLLLHGEDLRALNAAQFVELERRAQRIGLRPLLVDGDSILVAPWLAEATVGIYATYLADGRLPHPNATLPEQVVKILEGRRQSSNTRLEATVDALIETAGLPHRFRFLQGEANIAGIQGLPGEVDLLIADPARARLWVCEIKDPYMAFSPGTVKRRMAKFTKPDGHIAHVLRKAEVIESHVQLAATACGTTATPRWRVIPLVVTRWVEPVAFIADPKVAFTVPEFLLAVLNASQDPYPGFNA